MRRRFLVTGGARLMPFVRHERLASEHDVLVVDELTCAGHLDSQAPIKGHPRFEFVRGYVRDAAKIAASGPERNDVDSIELNSASGSTAKLMWAPRGKG